MLILHEKSPGKLALTSIADKADETETVAAFQARMIATHVKADSPRLVVAATNLPAVPVERWSVDWTNGAIAIIPEDLGVVRAEAIAEINRQAQAERGKYLTLGKDIVYLQKQSEARACLDDPSPAAQAPHPTTGVLGDKYPHLKAMIGFHVPATSNAAADLTAAAMIVLGRTADLRALSAKVESKIDAAKQQIEAAQTATAIRAVQVDWAGGS